MNVVVIGATGNAGTQIVKELVSRGHNVTAVSRNATTKVQASDKVKAVNNDLSNIDSIAEVIKGSDVVVSAYAPPANDTDQIIGATERIVKAIEKVGGKNGGPRLIVVGGAGGLNLKPGLTLHDSGYLPAEYLPISASHIATYKNLLKTDSIDWTYFAPAGFFVPGERTGKFRLGKDELIADEQGNSKISFEDYAIATVDEIENPKHRGQRFSIGY